MNAPAAPTAIAPQLVGFELIRTLVSCDTTSRESNLALIHWVRDYLARHGVESRLTYDDERRKANLFATLPAQDGTALLQQVQDRMHQLHTYQVDETLGPATPPLRAAYSFEAPDRMQLSFGDGETTVWVGPTRYTRDTVSGVWKAEDFGTSLPVPSFVWDIRSKCML